MAGSWFESWFDSPYYHRLYASRDLAEAEFFIANLVSHLRLRRGQSVLDLACGKGRHAFYLSRYELDVLGLDLSENSIREAQKLERENLRFAVHDMRAVYPGRSFDVVFNLFTSFGYFDDESDNLIVLQAVHRMLKPGGMVVIDFMNAEKAVKGGFTTSEVKRVDGVDFRIERIYDGRRFLKHIRFEDEGRGYHFTEKVQALTLDDFRALMEESGFDLLAAHGDYALNAFDAAHSPRLILEARRR